MNCIKIRITYCFGRDDKLPWLNALSKTCLLSDTLKLHTLGLSVDASTFFPLNFLVRFINLWPVDDQAIVNVGRNFY